MKTAWEAIGVASFFWWEAIGVASFFWWEAIGVASFFWGSNRVASFFWGSNRGRFIFLGSNRGCFIFLGAQAKLPSFPTRDRVPATRAQRFGKNSRNSGVSSERVANVVPAPMAGTRVKRVHIRHARGSRRES